MNVSSPVGSVVHQLYGIRIRTPWPVRGVAAVETDWDVEFINDHPDILAHAASFVPVEQHAQWAQYAALPDGSAYRRWGNLFEFLVTADARRIYARLIDDGDPERLLAYLLVDALSFSMVRLGLEPLHATAVTTPDGVIALLGDSGAGKSTLGGLLLAGGCRLVTDDMLILARDRGSWMAQPGPPRLKLYAAVAERILGSTENGVAMNPDTTKLILPVADRDMMPHPHRLRVLYILADDFPQPATPVIQRLAPAAAFPRVLAHTAAHYPSEPTRLKRQFEFVTTLVRDVPVKTLSYRRDQTGMPTLRDTVMADAAGQSRSR